MLISTKVKLGLLWDVETLLFFERGIRGGINGVGEYRDFIANNPHLNRFDPNGETPRKTFFDETSLYDGTIKNAFWKLQMEHSDFSQSEFGNARTIKC